MKQYHKLVRDKIPEIIEKQGNQCTIEILDEAAYLARVDAKLDEELAEYHAEPCLEELADLLEVIRAVITARGFTYEEVESIRKSKAEKRGGFAQKIWLRETNHP